MAPTQRSKSSVRRLREENGCISLLNQKIKVDFCLEREGMMAKPYPSTKDPLKLSPEECHPLKRPTRCINIESNLSGVVGRCTNQSSETRAAGLGKAETSPKPQPLSRPRCETHEEELERRPISRCSFNPTPLLWKLFLISCYLHVQVKNFIKANTHGFYGYLFLFGVHHLFWPHIKIQASSFLSC